MKTKNRKALPSVMIVLIVAIVLVISATFAAIFTTTESVSRLFTVSNLAATADVTFAGVADMSGYTDSNGIRASVVSGATNYIGNLRVSVNYKGLGVGLIRVRIAEEWSSTSEGVRTVRPYMLDIPYTVSQAYTSTDSGNAKKWFDNRKSDYCYYYATPVYGTSSVQSIALITGIDSSKIDLSLAPQDVDVHLVIQADVVQVNRYPQYWGFNILPWNGAASDTQMSIS